MRIKSFNFPFLKLAYKFIADSFYGYEFLVPEFFTEFTDMHVDGSSAHDYFISPNFVEDVFASKDFPGFGGKKGKQLEFFSGEDNFFFSFEDVIFLAIDRQITKLGNLLFFAIGFQATQQGIYFAY